MPGSRIVIPNAVATAQSYDAKLPEPWRRTLASLNVSAEQPTGVKIVVDKSDEVLRVLDKDGKLVAQFMATMGSEHDPLPIGTWKILGPSYNPPFHYNPDLFWDAKATAKAALLPPGPNGPVGGRLARFVETALWHPRDARAKHDRARRKPWLHPADQLGRGAAGLDGQGRARLRCSRNDVPRMMLRRIGVALAVLVLALLAVWIAAVRYLPDAEPEARATVVSTQAEAQTGGVLAVPVAGVSRGAIAESWGDPRDNGLRAHHGTDVLAPANTPVIAAAPGRVEKRWESVAGGTALYVRSPDRRWTYYYAHLAGYAPGLHEGQSVRAGEAIGFVGDTGNAGAGNYHLHFGLTRTTPEQHWYQGDDVDPYPYLKGRPLPK